MRSKSLLLAAHPAATYGEELKMGLLQLAGALIRTAAPQLQEHRKELLSFGWNHLKRDGSSCKYYAFLAVARFLVAFHAPEKITLQVRLRRQVADPGKELFNRAVCTVTIHLK